MDTLFQSWLELQCRMLSGVTSALVLPVHEGGVARPAAVWPTGTPVDTLLSTVAQQAVSTGSEFTDSPNGQAIVALPLLMNGRVQAVVALALTRRDAQARDAVLQTLRWGGFWLDLLMRARESAAGQQTDALMGLVEKALGQANFQAAAMEIATQLATLLDCSRVAIGLKKRHGIQVQALSHTVRLDPRSTLIQQLNAAMDEAADQDVTLIWPPEETARHIARRHEVLAREQNDSGICTVLFGEDGRILGAITFERHQGPPFDATTRTSCETATRLMGPLLLLKQRARTGPIKSLRHRLSGRKPLLTTVGLLLMLAAAGLTLVPVTYHVDADALLRGSVQRSVVAPIDGFVAEAPVRPGDAVTSHELLARMDDRDLHIQQVKWQGEKARLEKEYREALAQHDRTQVSVLRSKLDQAQAELDLAEKKLARTRITAPISGIVVSGDLSQSLGAPVSRGDTLFEIAPLNDYRVELEVDERDIADIRPGARGALRLSGQPGITHPLHITRITPLASAEEGRNFFRVEGQLDRPDPALRPGMQGVGKVEAGKRSLLWIGGHRIWNWLRLKLWAWGL